MENNKRFWNNIALFALGLTVIGQIVIGKSYLLAESIWLASNIITLTRDFVLKRPVADKIKNSVLTAITIGLIIAFFLGAFN